MYLKKFWFNNVGATLTELMVGVGLLGGISLVTMKVMQDQSSNQSYLKWTAAVNMATSQVVNALNNDQRCKEMLVGQTRDSNPYPANTSFMTIPLRINTGTGWQVLLAPDTEYAEGFYIPANGIQLAAQGSSTNQLTELIITFKTRNRVLSKNNPTIKNTTEKGTIIKRIPFITELNGQTIRACGKVVADNDVIARKTMCDSLGGAATWNAGTSTCTLNEVKCADGMVPTTMTSIGGVVCSPVTTAGIRDQLFDYSSSTCAPGQGVTLAAGADGKIRATCTGVATGCAPMTVTWYVNAAQTFGNSANAACTASLGAGAWGASASAVDGTGPITGTKAYSCDMGRKTWVASGAESCQDTSLACAAGVIRWSGTTKFCYANHSAMNHGQTGNTVSDTTNEGGSDGMGTAFVECVSGRITIKGSPPATCN